MELSDALEIFDIEQEDFPTYTEDSLKERYRQCTLHYHPDHGGTATDFKDLQEAYEVLKSHLSDPTIALPAPEKLLAEYFQEIMKDFDRYLRSMPEIVSRPFHSSQGYGLGTTINFITIIQRKIETELEISRKAIVNHQADITNLGYSLKIYEDNPEPMCLTSIFIKQIKEKIDTLTDRILKVQESLEIRKKALEISKTWTKIQWTKTNARSTADFTELYNQLKWNPTK